MARDACSTVEGAGISMTPAQFRTNAEAIAGKHWPTRLGPIIGKCRSQVWEYANGKREVPETVAKLLGMMVEAIRK